MSVILKGRNGNELELAFVKDSMPELQDGAGDNTWFTVIWRAATADDAWEESSPCINTYEFRTLAEWLEIVGRGDSGDVGGAELSEVELLAPELKFSVSQQDNEGIGIRVGFHLEDRPEMFNVDAETDEAEYIDLYMSRASILAASRELRALVRELEGNAKDDLTGNARAGMMGVPDDDLNLVDRIMNTPPGAGFGVDNAGNGGGEPEEPARKKKKHKARRN